MTNRSEIIDVHYHILPPFYVDAATNAGFGAALSSGFPSWNLSHALEFMERCEISAAIQSISQPGVHFGNDTNARGLARKCNEYMAEVVVRHSRRFGSFAVLPLPDVDGALEEITYALDVLKLDGVGLLASYGDSFLGDPKFDPVLSLLNERKAVVFIHPNYHPSSRGLKLDLPGFLVEFPIDTTRAVTNLIFSGTLDRFQNIKFILSHAGGAIPYLSHRLSLAPLIDKRFSHLSENGILTHLKRFYFDTAQSASGQVMRTLGYVTDEDKILFGSDWPYCPESVATATIEGVERFASDANSDPKSIFSDNALKLFSRLREARGSTGVN